MLNIQALYLSSISQQSFQLLILMHNRKYFSLFVIMSLGIFLLFNASEVFSQRVSKKSIKYFNEAISAYQSGYNTQAENLLNLSLQSDANNLKAWLLMADIAKDNQNQEQQLFALENVMKRDSLQYPLVAKLLAQIYFSKGLYQKARHTIEMYEQIAPETDSVFVAAFIERCNAATQLSKNKIDMEIIHLDSTVNTAENEYWPFISADDSILYFTRLISNEKPFLFERMFYSQYEKENWHTAEVLSLGGADEVNEGTLSMSADGRLLFFTACGRPDGLGSCDIFYRLKTNGVWGPSINAGNMVNSFHWEAQPSVSAYADMLYWVSNRPGGMGKKDIWCAPIIDIKNGKLQFGEAKNLGPGVNTIDDDFSPFIHADGITLYFASNGHYGMGNSDSYLSRFEHEHWQVAVNLGSPINTSFNDDGLVVSPTAHLAVFSSDREGAINHSKDLYTMHLPEQFQPNKTGYVKGVVYDLLSNKKLSAIIELSQIESGKSHSLITDEHDGYLITLDYHSTYAFNISMPGYLFYSRRFDLTKPSDFNNAEVFNIGLQPIAVDARVVLNNVFFDHDSYIIKPESITELEEIIVFLKMNTSINIEISGHTDNTGNDAYNLNLSKQRAAAIADYLHHKIDSKRIQAKGYGSVLPVADNKTDEGRRKNRRSELRIISY